MINLVGKLIFPKKKFSAYLFFYLLHGRTVQTLLKGYYCNNDIISQLRGKKLFHIFCLFTMRTVYYHRQYLYIPCLIILNNRKRIGYSLRGRFAITGNNNDDRRSE